MKSRKKLEFEVKILEIALRQVLWYSNPKLSINDADYKKLMRRIAEDNLRQISSQEVGIQ
jgi:hypothetical protein